MANKLVYNAATGQSELVAMTPQEEADFEASRTITPEMLAAMRDAVVAKMDETEDYMRAFALAVLDEFNAHSVKINAILTAIDNGGTVAQIKNNIAAIVDQPQRTIAQLKTAVRSKLGS